MKAHSLSHPHVNVESLQLRLCDEVLSVSRHKLKEKEEERESEWDSANINPFLTSLSACSIPSKSLLASASWLGLSGSTSLLDTKMKRGRGKTEVTNRHLGLFN